VTITTVYDVDHNELVVTKYDKVVTVYYKIRAYLTESTKKAKNKHKNNVKSKTYNKIQ